MSEPDLVAMAARAGDPARFRRIAVAGASGCGKSTLARRLADRLGSTYVDMDGLYYGPSWQPREEFTDEALRAIDDDDWVTEWQYDQVAHRLAQRAQLVIWLAYPPWLSMTSVVCRTALRRLHHESLWSGNREASVMSVLWRRDHVFRYAWRGPAVTGRSLAKHLLRLPDPPVLWKFERPLELSSWLVDCMPDRLRTGETV